MRFTYFNVFVLIAFVMQCLMFFLPDSTIWLIKFFPAIIVSMFVLTFVFLIVLYFILCMINAFVIAIKIRKEMLKIPKKDD